jgi:hypothetical protein
MKFKPVIIWSIRNYVKKSIEPNNFNTILKKTNPI